jgi:hypothetical protein
MKSSPITSTPHDVVGGMLAATSCSDTTGSMLLPYIYLTGVAYASRSKR